MTSFTHPSDHWAPVRTACHSLFPLNRLRLSVHLRRSPSIQLHLQHDSMVDDQSTPRVPSTPSSVCTVLNQPRAIVLLKSHKHSGPCRVFPRPENGYHRHHAPMSSSPIPPSSSVPTDSCRSVRLSSLTQPNYSGCTTRSRLPNHLP